jgi:hypothetical protein
MLAFILQRLIQAVIVMVTVAFIAFLLFQYVGDPVVFLLGQDARPEQIAQLRRDLGLDPAKVNPNGSGISLGHPIGATGALITVKALHELHRIQGRYALVTMCIGGGQGIAAIFERA